VFVNILNLMNDTSRSYILDVSDEVPDFRLDSQLGAIRFRDLIDGKWCLLVSIHKAFDPVATTEIGALQKLLDEFTARNIAVVVISNDSVSNYRKWIKDINELELTQIEIPLVSDPGAVTLKQYGVVREIPPYGELKVTSVGTFLIDMDKRIRSSMKYSINAGISFWNLSSYNHIIHSFSRT
jgi:alkyl hydroperoxide reductase subunit AhpC